MVYLSIKEMLKKRKKTKYWLVKQMESDYTTIGDMMDNKTISIRFETIDKLCRLLECEPEDIIKRK